MRAQQERNRINHAKNNESYAQPDIDLALTFVRRRRVVKGNRSTVGRVAGDTSINENCTPDGEDNCQVDVFVHGPILYHMVIGLPITVLGSAVGKFVSKDSSLAR